MSKAAFVYCATCGAANPPDAAACFACGHPPLIADAHAPTSSPPTSLLAAQGLLKQRYRLLAQVGSGGFGAVYQAEDTELGNRLVAVKEMSQRGLTPEEVQEATQAFRNEALLLAGLTHPHLPRIYEQFSEGGRWYLVMDFIEGETLEARLARAPGGRLPVPEVLRLGAQLCAVLDYLHTRQPPIIFRDLKPANIMLTQSGDLYLIDFGIARHFKPGQTKDTVAFGSAGYAAPEQYGKAQTTTQADIYSLGATLHQLLSGSDPSDSPFLFAPLHLAEPAGLEALLMQMLETQPSKRPASMAVIKQDLQRMADDLAAGRKLQQPVAAHVPISPKHIHTPLLVYQGHTDQVNAVAWSPDGRIIASASYDGILQVWDAATGIMLFSCRGHYRDVRSVSWSPDSRYVASGGFDKVVHIWAVDRGQLALTYRNHIMPVGAVAWSPTGQWIASGSGNGVVDVWDALTGERRFTSSGHTTGVYTAAWSPDGQRLATGSSDKTVLVWNVLKSIAYRYTGHSNTVYAVAWSPDGRRIASAGEDKNVQVWNTAGHLLSRYPGSGERVGSIAWSPDSRYIALVGTDGTAQVWDATTGIHLFTYHGHTQPVTAVAWSPNGGKIASAGRDNTVHIWQVA